MKSNITTLALSAFAVTCLSIAFVGCSSSPDSSSGSTTGGASTTTTGTTATTGTTGASTATAGSTGTTPSASGSTGTPPSATSTGAGTSTGNAPPSHKGDLPTEKGSKDKGAGMSKAPSDKAGSTASNSTVSKFATIQPVLTANCACHLGDNPAGKLDLRSYAGVMKGSEDGPVVKAGDSSNSVLSWAVNHTHSVKPMPMRAPKLSAADIKKIDQWIDQGAKQ